MRKTLFIVLMYLMGTLQNGFSQEKGVLSGDFQSNTSFYQYDEKIGTYTQVYLQQLSSVEAWMLLNYRVDGYNFTVRYDLFNNSPLMNPQEAYSKQGLGFFSLSKDVGKLNITAGSFYDQFGSGLIFRAFEDRVIGLDYAIQGVRVKYNPTDSIRIKAFTGVQKNRLDIHPQIIKGANAEINWGIKDGFLAFETGVGVVNRTLDQNTIQLLTNRINSLPFEERFNPKYNMYAMSIYNTLTIGKMSIYAEYAKKTKEAINQEVSFNDFKLVNKDGDVSFLGLNYSGEGFGLNVQYKKVNTFVMRTYPDATFNLGVINYLPPLSKQHAYRLPSRYAIAARDQGEEGIQGEFTFSAGNHNTFTLASSYVLNPIEKNSLLYKEYYIDYTKKFNKRWRAIGGLQYVEYDIRFYQGKPEAPMVKAFTPFAEVSVKIDKQLRKSIRAEFQYMSTRQDFGDFINALIEFNWAPHYSFSISNMVNNRPVKQSEIINYPTIFGSYTYKQTRFTAGYIKQVEGIVCTGGVCRLEPAFSGFRVGLSTNF